MGLIYQLIIKFMKQGQNKRRQQIRAEESDDSSSLQFLGTQKQEDMNDNNDEMCDADVDNNFTFKRPNIQRNQSVYRKKDKVQQQQNSQSIFLYKPQVQLPHLFNFTNQTIKMIIASQYINKDNPAFIKRKIYGNDTYSSNSDCVCIGIHYGFFSFHNFNYKKYQGVQITFKVVKPKKNYLGSYKNGLQSQTIKNYNGNALKPQSCKMLANLGQIQNLQKYAANMHVPIGRGRIRSKPQKLSSIVPIPQSNIVFNMNNQPAFKYSIYNIADKGFDKSSFFVRRLDNKSLYFETETKQRYELSKYIQKTFFEVYRFSKIKNPFKFDNEYYLQHSPPMDVSDLEIIQQYVELDQILFGQKTIRIKDKVIDKLVSFKYYVIQQK